MINYIESTYESLERTGHEQTFNSLVAGLHDYFNSDKFVFSEVFSDSYKYSRGLFAACANIQTLQRMVDKQGRDHEKPVFLSHMLLIKASTLNDMTDYLPVMVNLIQQQQLEDVGTTLGQAIGYLTGLGIRRGQNVSALVGLYSNRFIEDEDYFLKGLKEGLNSSSSLVSRNTTYMSNLLDRYDEWDADSVKVIIKVFKNITQRTGEEGYIKENERILWLLQGLYYNNKMIQNLYHTHHDLLGKTSGMSEDSFQPHEEPIEAIETSEIHKQNSPTDNESEAARQTDKASEEKPPVSKKDYSRFL